jgi:NADPH:quinone reductase-like Zn-dependent oxidoreductase
LVAVPSRQLARKPINMTHEEAGALPLAGLTAWQSLVDAAQLKAGDRVLVHAAGGGVGHLAVQIAKDFGAYVIGTASAAKHDFVRSLGADEVIDYQNLDFAEQVRDVDIVLVSVGGDYGERSLRTLRPGGQLVTIVGRTDAELARRTRGAGMKFVGISVEPDYPGLEALAHLVETGRLKVNVASAFPLEKAADAHRFLASGPQGKVVLVP